MMKSRYDTLYNIPKNYWICSYVGATISTCKMEDTFVNIFVKLKLFLGDAD